MSSYFERSMTGPLLIAFLFLRSDSMFAYDKAFLTGGGASVLQAE